RHKPPDWTMTRIALQISPQARSAYFKDYLQVAEQELRLVMDVDELPIRRAGPLEFLELDCSEESFASLLRLSFVQGLYIAEGTRLTPLDSVAEFSLHEDFVFGQKYKGKTNEHLTQLLLNMGLTAIGAGPGAGEGIKLLDPMCGRGTTLLWAMRYGMKAKGIEQDARVIADIHRNLKKWTKLHKVKHKLSQGFVGKANKKDLGKFINFSLESTAMRVIVGDAREADKLLKNEKFDLIVSDIPYGVQHFTTEKTRNPLAVLTQSIEAWKQSLKSTGAVVLAFNSYLPKRTVLIDTFEQAGFEAQLLSAPHRMSESIVRDIVVFKLPGLPRAPES
ncbi:MAG: hypothetical protein V7746_20640, partial [Halioglobus sp.]